MVGHLYLAPIKNEILHLSYPINRLLTYSIK